MSTAGMHEDIHEDIQHHREELAHTVDALAAKLDVRPRMSAALRRAAAPAAGILAALLALRLWRRRHRS